MFHEDGGVTHPGFKRPLEPDEEPSMTDLFHAATDDLKVKLLNWAERDNVLFGEWELTCTLAGRPFKIEGVNRFTLRGDKATGAKGYSDRLPVLRFFCPDLQELDLIEKLKAIAAQRQ